MRKRRAVKRDVLPDPVYNSKVITKLMGEKPRVTEIVMTKTDSPCLQRTSFSVRNTDGKQMKKITDFIQTL